MKRQKISIDIVDDILSKNLYDLTFSEINGKTRLNTVFKDDQSNEIKILTFKEGP